MNQKGDKILTLAGSILQGGTILLDKEKTSRAEKERAYEVALQAAGLAALASVARGAMARALALASNRPINRYEKTEIEALVFYAARTLGASETGITLRLMDDLGYIHMDHLNVADYRLIRNYMWQLLLQRR